jgi:enoyl-CoA hydratase/carnithine racemase
MSAEFEFIRYEGVTNGVAQIALARPDKRNAQNKAMLYELNEALDTAAHDDDCKVILLSADGPDFSSGHDMKDRDPLAASVSQASKVTGRSRKKCISASAGAGAISPSPR